MPTMINTFLVDDHDLVRLGIRSLLAAFDDIKIIGEAVSGEEAIKLILKLKPDVVLMDLNMPGIGGLEAARRILHINPQIKIIAVTMCTEDVFSCQFMRLGAAGYIAKTADANELVGAIRKVYRGQSYIAPAIAQSMALRQSSDNSAPFEKLSRRELQIMWMVIRGDSAVNIAERLHLSPKTVNTYRYRLHEKLEIKNDIELTHMALNYGLLDHNPPLAQSDTTRSSAFYMSTPNNGLAVNGSLGANA
jgi:two-component system invasion response regulator UvrY